MPEGLDATDIHAKNEAERILGTFELEIEEIASALYELLLDLKTEATTNNLNTEARTVMAAIGQFLVDATTTEKTE